MRVKIITLLTYHVGGLLYLLENHLIYLLNPQFCKIRNYLWNFGIFSNSYITVRGEETIFHLHALLFS